MSALDGTALITIDDWVIDVHQFGVGWEATITSKSQFIYGGTPETTFVGTTKDKARVIIDAINHATWLTEQKNEED